MTRICRSREIDGNTILKLGGWQGSALQLDQLDQLRAVA